MKIDLDSFPVPPIFSAEDAEGFQLLSFSVPSSDFT